jgi:acylglycerol lipase
VEKRSVVVVHGFAEHSGRYEHVGSQLAAQDCAVHAYDQQGNGRSDGTRCHVRRFDDLLDDLDAIVEQVRTSRPELPLFVVGHSMGGLVVSAYARERRPDVAGVATSGAALALSDDFSSAKILAARLLRRIAPKLPLASGLDPAALSRDTAVVRAYLDDPLVESKMTTSLGAEMIAAIGRTAGGGKDVSVPMMMMHGEDDTLCPVRGTLDFYAELEVTGKRLQVYEGLRHEIFNEPEQNVVLGDLMDWMRGVQTAKVPTA